MTGDELTGVYDAMLTTGRMGSVRRVEYRCRAQGCILLHVFEVPDVGIVVGFPRHKLSAAETEATTVPAARARHTEDGRHWRAMAAPRGEVSVPVLACDHVRGVRLPDAALDTDWRMGRTVVLVAADGTRHAQGRGR